MMAPSNPQEGTHTHNQSVGSLCVRFSTSIDQQSPALRRRTHFKTHNGHCQTKHKSNLPEMVMRRPRTYPKPYKFTLKKKNTMAKIPRKQGVQSQDLSSLANMPPAPHNTTQYIVQTTCSASDYWINGDSEDSAWYDTAGTHSMLGTMRGNITFSSLNQSLKGLNSCSMKDETNERWSELQDSRSNPQAASAPTSMDLEEAMVTNLRLQDQQPNSLLLRNGATCLAKEHLNAEKLIARIQSHPGETEEIVEDLVRQVQFKENMIQNLMIKH